MSVALDSPVDGSVERSKRAFDADFEVDDGGRPEEFRADSHEPLCDPFSCHG